MNTLALFYLSKSFNLSFSPSLSLFDFLITLRFDFCKKALFIFVRHKASYARTNSLLKNDISYAISRIRGTSIIYVSICTFARWHFTTEIDDTIHQTGNMIAVHYCVSYRAQLKLVHIYYEQKTRLVKIRASYLPRTPSYPSVSTTITFYISTYRQVLRANK